MRPQTSCALSYSRLVPHMQARDNTLPRHPLYSAHAHSVNIGLLHQNRATEHTVFRQLSILNNCLEISEAAAYTCRVQPATPHSTLDWSQAIANHLHFGSPSAAP